MRKVLFFSTTRSDYGLVSPITQKIKKDKNLKYFLVLTSSHINKSFGNTIKEMIANYNSGNMLAIMEVDKKDVSSYGVISPGKSIDNNVTDILGLVEKPSVEKAPSNMAVVGRYIIEPAVFDVLEKQNKGTSNEIQLTDAIASRIGKSDCVGYKFSEDRFDCGSKLGFIQANIRFSIERPEMKQKLKSWLKCEIFSDD